MADACILSVRPSHSGLNAVLARHPARHPRCTSLRHAGLKLGRAVAKVTVRRLHTSPAPLALAGAARQCRCTLRCHSTMQGTHHGGASLIMSYCPKSVAMRLEETLGGPLQQQEVVAIALDILEGLVQLHDLHIFHQNLKPENVLFNDYGHAYLSDFGVDHTVESHAGCSRFGLGSDGTHRLVALVRQEQAMAKQHQEPAVLYGAKITGGG